MTNDEQCQIDLKYIFEYSGHTGLTFDQVDGVEPIITAGVPGSLATCYFYLNYVKTENFLVKLKYEFIRIKRDPRFAKMIHGDVSHEE